MVISFCGHSSYVAKNVDEQMILDILQTEIGNEKCEIFLGGYGNFDSFAYSCAKKFKAANPNVKLIFITPYRDEKYIKEKMYGRDEIDEIVYPPLEHVPLRYAISRRNRWIVEHSDIIIAYISHAYGGAYETYKFATKKNVKVFNVCESF